MKITEIVFLNDVIVKHRESGATVKMLQVSYKVSFLALLIYHFTAWAVL